MKLVVIWLDHERAKLFHFSEEKMEREEVRAPLGDPSDLPAYYRNLVQRVLLGEKILLMGPGTAKQDFRTFLVDHQPVLARGIVGFETLDHPSDAQIAAHAMRFFSSESA